MDETVHVAMMNLLWPRTGIEVQQFYDYWVGAHTQISSRLPGIYQYFQHQLSPEGGRLLPRIEGVSQDFEPPELFYGDAEITFLTRGDLGRFVTSLGPLMEDEQNVFRKTISYQAVGEQSFTLVDRTLNQSPNGHLDPHQKFMLYLRRRHGVTLEEFRSAVASEVAPTFAAASEVVKVRVRLPEFYDNDQVALLAPNVSNHEDPERQYQGCLEVVFADPIGRQNFCIGGGWANATAKLARVASTVHRQHAVKTFTVYNNGSITTAGLRTPDIASQIAQMGAVNQVGEDIRRLLLREHAALRESPSAPRAD